MAGSRAGADDNEGWPAYACARFDCMSDERVQCKCGWMRASQIIDIDPGPPARTVSVRLRLDERARIASSSAMTRRRTSGDCTALAGSVFTTSINMHNDDDKRNGRYKH